MANFDDILQQLQVQLKSKDLQIIELNEALKRKDGRILDLQEMCHDQGQVAQSKSIAVQIVSKRLKEIDTRKFCDVGTETDLFLSDNQRGGKKATLTPQKQHKRGDFSPGRAIPSLNMSRENNSPPPLDPTEDTYSDTSFYNDLDENMTNNSFFYSPKQLQRLQRKKVTFDMNSKKPTSKDSPLLLAEASKLDDHFKQNYDYGDLVMENDQLRKIIAEMENSQTVLDKIKQKNQDPATMQLQVNKARALAQSRIKEMTLCISNAKSVYDKEIENLKTLNETLKNSREWTLNENGNLLMKITEMKVKLEDLHGELDASLNTNTLFRNRLDEEEKKREKLVELLDKREAFIQVTVDEKTYLQSEVDRLKEAIFAQDEFIRVLEADLVVYETRVGLLRDSLGASKKDQREIIKTKAYTAKLNTLESEKQEFIKRKKEEKIRIKAFTVKISCLEQERNELFNRLRHYEKEYGINREQYIQKSSANQSLESLSATPVRSFVPKLGFCSTPQVIYEESNVIASPVSVILTGENLSTCTNKIDAIDAETPEQQKEQPFVDIAKTLNAQISNLYSNLLATNPRIFAQIDSNTTDDDNFEEQLALTFEYFSKIYTGARDFISELERVNAEHLKELETTRDLLHLKEESIVEIRQQFDDERETLKQKFEAFLSDKEKQFEDVLIKEKVTLGEATRQLNEIKLQLNQTTDELTRVNNRLSDADSQLKEQKKANVLLTDSKARLENKLEDMDKHLLELMVEKEDYEQKLGLLQADISYLNLNLSNKAASHERLVDLLRNEVDRFRIEAELSRSCLEDLRGNIQHSNLLFHLPVDDTPMMQQRHSLNFHQPKLVVPQKNGEIFESFNLENRSEKFSSCEVTLKHSSKQFSSVQHFVEPVAAQINQVIPSFQSLQNTVFGDLSSTKMEDKEAQITTENSDKATDSRDLNLENDESTTTTTIAASEAQNQMNEFMCEKVKQMMELNAELVINSDLLKSEIWSLNLQYQNIHEKYEAIVRELNSLQKVLYNVQHENTCLKQSKEKEDFLRNSLQSELQLTTSKLIQIEDESRTLIESLEELQEKYRNKDANTKEGARLLSKSTSNENLTRYNSELVEANIQLQKNVEELQKKLEQVSSAKLQSFDAEMRILDAVTENLHSNPATFLITESEIKDSLKELEVDLCHMMGDDLEAIPALTTIELDAEFWGNFDEEVKTVHVTVPLNRPKIDETTFLSTPESKQKKKTKKIKRKKEDPDSTEKRVLETDMNPSFEDQTEKREEDNIAETKNEETHSDWNWEMDSKWEVKKDSTEKLNDAVNAEANLEKEEEPEAEEKEADWEDW